MKSCFYSKKKNLFLQFKCIVPFSCLKSFLAEGILPRISPNIVTVPLDWMALGYYYPSNVFYKRNSVPLENRGANQFCLVLV